MRFADEARIEVKAGDGGHGCLSFLRERFKPRGGPDGGNGGSGGDIILHATENLNTLVDFSSRRRFKAPSGVHGRGANCHGRDGEDLLLTVPVGTVVYDEDSDALLGDLREDGNVLRVVRGGCGGMGNAHFKSSTNRAPRRTTDGEPGECKQLRLVLNVLADVGLWGAPNVGKSSLLAAMSAARPKIGNYAFTTLWPNLGAIPLSDGERYVLADIPGLLPGASSGVGLGTRFLKHLNRTRLLLHVIDVSAGEQCVEQARLLRQEVHTYSAELGARESWLLLNKCDLCDADEADAQVDTLRSQLQWSKPIFKVSAWSLQGLPALQEAIAHWLSENNRSARDDQLASSAQQLIDEK